MEKLERDFYEIFTELQCFILANMHRGEVNGVTATHYNLIEYIYRHDGCTGKDLAKAFSISSPAISRQIKFLLGNGLVGQDQSPSDRRVFNLSATDKGRFIVDNSENFRKTLAQKASQTLTTTELKNLTSLLSKILDLS